MNENLNICKGCGQECKLKSELESHTLSCIFFNRSLYKKIREQTEQYKGMEEMVSYLKTDFFKTIVSYYDKKFEVLETENTKLKKEIQSIKNTLNMRSRKRIADILNHSNYTGPTFPEWVESFRISNTDLDHVFENDLFEGMKHSIKGNIANPIMVPIRGFNEKKNSLYMYFDNKETKTKEWRLASTDDIHRLIFVLSRRFIKKFLEWCSENESRIDTDETMRENQIVYMIKMNGGNKSEEKMVSEMKEWLFSVLHTNIDYIIL